MAKFLQIEKLTTDLTGTSTLIINSEDILLVDEQTPQNRATQQTETVRRVVLVGYPSYSFMTRTSYAAFEAVLNTVDFSNGPGVGSSCTVPGVLDIVNIAVNYPTVKLNRIKNNTILTTDPHIVNLNYLYLAEEIPFMDEELNVQVTGFMISLKGQPLERFLAKITLEELRSVLEPTVL